MKLDPRTVSDTVETWNMLFPFPKPKAFLAVISAKFYKALSPIYSDEAFRIATQIVESETDQFPTIAAMRKAQDMVVDELERIRDAQRPLLPEESSCELTPEEIAQNQEKMQVIKDMLAGAMSLDEAVKRQEQLKTYEGKR